MPAQIFTDVLKQASTAGITNTRSADARDWFRDKAQDLRGATPSKLMQQSRDEYRNRLYPGHLYFFYYDPKHKQDLPYYDTFPLIFPIEIQGDYILGMNMHYLGYVFRARLMDALYQLSVNNSMNETLRLRLSYQVLNNSSRYKYFKPCVKKYLRGHVRSRFVKVDPQSWETALFLPVEQFQKATKQKVFDDSRRIIAGSR